MRILVSDPPREPERRLASVRAELFIGSPGANGDTQREHGPASGHGVDFDSSSQEMSALPHTYQTKRLRSGDLVFLNSPSVISDFQHEFSVDLFNDDVDLAGLGVPENISHGLLKNSEDCS